MPKPRRVMTARVVPLNSREASEARVGGTAAERLALLARMSEISWRLSGQAFPCYTRATMPIVVTTLKSQSENARST